MAIRTGSFQGVPIQAKAAGDLCEACGPRFFRWSQQTFFAVRFAVAFTVFWPVAAVQAEEVLGDAFQACVTLKTDPVAVSPTLERDIFRSEAGQGYVLTDIVLRDGDNPATGSQVVQDVGASRFLAYPAASINRWGLVPAWIGVQDGNWRVLLQEQLVQAGEVIAAPAVGTPSCAAKLKRLEAAARRVRRGLWREHKILSTRQPDVLLKQAGHYVVAEGRIVSLGKTRRNRYLNFGFRWKSDFTVTLKASDEAGFDAALAAENLKIADLEGAAVRVRGFVRQWDGPHMELKHPGQLDVIEFKKGTE